MLRTIAPGITCGGRRVRAASVAFLCGALVCSLLLAGALDAVAPGRSILSLRAPGSMLDEQNPGAVVGERFSKGSRTFQASAVVSGAAPLLFEQHPGITSDQMKKWLALSSGKLAQTDPVAQGAGLIDLRKTGSRTLPAEASSAQPFAPSAGYASLDAARESSRISDLYDAEDDGTLDEHVLAGEMDMFGAGWNASSSARASAAENSWVDGLWKGHPWSGTVFSDPSWSGVSWSGRRWSSLTWSGRRWSSARWFGRQWSSDLSTGRQWSGRQWSGRQWSRLLGGRGLELSPVRS